MIFLHTLLLAVALLTSMQERFRAYRMQLKAYALYEQHAYSEAQVAFEGISAVAREEKERATAAYNLGCALYMQGKFGEAATLFARSAKPESQNRSMQLRATTSIASITSIFNEGDALAMMAMGESSKARKTILFRQSLNRFKTVLLTQPGDGDAKINYEIVSRYLRELETPEKKSSPQPLSGISNNITDRLLDNARQDESSIMQRPPRIKAPANRGNHNEKDW